MPSLRQLPKSPSLVPTIILADDLTGACDSAAVFAERGLKTRVALDIERCVPMPGQVNACSLESRNLPEQAAAWRHLRTAGGWFSAPDPRVLFCKIDSAGRGPIGEGILSLLDASGCGWALVTPAFPDHGRSVNSGVLHILEQDGEVRQIEMERLFPNRSRTMLATIGGGDAAKRRDQMREMLAGGRRILLCDAETREDLSAVVEAARQVECGSILWCGSAGLARALAESLFSSLEAGADPAPPYKEGKICLLFAGTPHPATARQVETLTSSNNAARCATITIQCGETTAEQVREHWVQTQHSGGPRGIILTGGDTASLVLRALGAEAILSRGEVASGIPWGVIEGGLATGYRVVTKSGGFGGRDALVNVVTFLEKSA